ncbi:hypothetical protein F5B20DRAFT_554572 [Whalleya microplaca]|nr:hypothetical protein F5B20DRAFT_554572 [Whalleya microplaca]
MHVYNYLYPRTSGNDRGLRTNSAIDKQAPSTDPLALLSAVRLTRRSQLTGLHRERSWWSWGPKPTR